MWLNACSDMNWSFLLHVGDSLELDVFNSHFSSNFIFTHALKVKLFNRHK